jgi:hypothetical protein
MVVERFTADCAFDGTAERVSREQYDVAAKIIAGRWIIEVQIEAGDY